MSLQRLPVTSAPNCTFTTTLAVDGANLTLTFTFRYNELVAYWLMDIANALGLPLLASIPLVPGDDPAGNILHQYQYLNIGSCFVIKISDTTEQYPGETSLGTDWVLAWDDTR